MVKESVGSVCHVFNLSSPLSIQKISSGLINQSFLIKNLEGLFVVQKMHPVFNENTCVDAKIVTDFLRSHGVLTPTYLTTTNGDPFVFVDGTVWRIMRNLPGRSIETVTNPKLAQSSGALLRKIHRALRDFDYLCTGSIPHFHDTPYLFEQFLTIVRGDNRFSRLLPPVRKEIKMIVDAVPKELLPERLPRKVIHGDLKISNFLFDEIGTATALLDFDTCMNQTALIDIGDALRSWCNTAGEDTEDTKFDRDIYDATLRGYFLTASISKKERSLIPQAFRLLVIEQAMRFLNDYFEDTYYGWDQARFSSRREHNLVRCRGQINLYRQIASL